MKKIFIVLFTTILLTGGIITFVGKDKLFSQNENRYLSTMPKISIQSIVEGEFQKSFTDYASDQFFGRDVFMAMATEIKKAFGRKDIGGAYIGKNGSFFEKKLQKDINLKRYERNLKKIESIAVNNRNKKVKIMLVPSAAIIYNKNLPKNGEEYDYSNMYDKAEKVLRKCQVIDVRESMKKSNDNLFYKTDHHWTLEGAYAAYYSMTGKQCTFKQKEVCNDFLGTLYSKVIDVSAKKTGNGDIIKIPELEKNIRVKADEKEIDIFDMKALKEKDKYKVFFGGNYGKIKITGEGKKSLLIIKDSFANCFAPLLVKDYKNITMIDMRYFAGDINALIKETDQLLILYEMSNFANDSNISKLGILL